jgi:hypothetical protein
MKGRSLRNSDGVVDIQNEVHAWGVQIDFMKRNGIPLSDAEKDYSGYGRYCGAECEATYLEKLYKNQTGYSK